MDPASSLKHRLIIEEIKFHLNNLCHVVNSRMNYEKIKILFDIKNFSDSKYCNSLKAEIIYNKLISALKTFLKFYSRKEKYLRIKVFLKWEQLSSTISNFDKYKKEVSIYEIRIHEKDKELREVKTNISKYLELENELIKKVKNFEEKENNFMAVIKKVEDEKLTLVEELKEIKRTSSDKNENHKSLEEKV